MQPDQLKPLDTSHELAAKTPMTSSSPAAVSVPADSSHHNAPGLIVLQWLTYAFWGWTIVALSVLVGVIINTIVNRGTWSSGVAPYATAAVLVLAPIAFICDSFYNKHEPRKKTGAASLVMVIHAVLFALISIGSLITLVFSAVELFTGGTIKAFEVSAITSGIITVLYALTFLRTLNPNKFSWLQKWYKFIMLVLIVIIAVAGFLGPLRTEREAKNDRLIETNLGAVKYAIDDYVNDNEELPKALTDLKLSGGPQELVTKQLVVYKPEGAAKVTTYSTSGTASYKYQLCVTYKKASASNYYVSTSEPAFRENGGYSAYLSNYQHPAGEVCYKLLTDTYAYPAVDNPPDASTDIDSF